MSKRPGKARPVRTRGSGVAAAFDRVERELRQVLGELDDEAPLQLALDAVERARAGTLGASGTETGPHVRESSGQSRLESPATRALGGLRVLGVDLRRSLVHEGVIPLRLKERGLWDPREHYWGDESQPPTWAQAIVARGPRSQYEMEQIVPGTDRVEDPEDDPIVRAAELKAQGELAAAQKLLFGLLAEDLRCLDAHAHLGNIDFDDNPRRALGHYWTGVSIAEITLGDSFEGVLPWGCLDNRPFLRCLSGCGITAWRLEAFDVAQKVFEWLLWLNPTDNQGARFVLPEIVATRPWHPDI